MSKKEKKKVTFLKRVFNVNTYIYNKNQVSTL